MQSHTKHTVLSIDDEEIYREMISISLEFHGLNVLQAEDGLTGLNLARSAHPDLILLDLVMPGLDGAAVCRKIMQDENLRKIPVIVLSGSEDTDEIKACIQLGAVDYLLKPFEPRLLANLVQRHLR